MLEYKKHEPKNRLLSPYVHSYESSIGKVFGGEEKFITRALPSFFTQIYFEFEGDISEIQTKNSKSSVIKRRSYVNTSMSSWFDIYQLPRKEKFLAVKNFKINLYPHALFEIFGIPPLRLQGYDIWLEDIWDCAQDFKELSESLESCTCGDEMVKVFESHLSKKITDNSHRYTSKILLQKRDDLKSLCEEMGYSARWVQNKHKEILGFSFKEYQSNIRFLNTLSKIHLHVKQNSKINLSLLALESGYYDQAHFTKEFKRFTGYTPSQYLALLDSQIVFFW